MSVILAALGACADIAFFPLFLLFRHRDTVERTQNLTPECLQCGVHLEEEETCHACGWSYADDGSGTVDE